ncbi:MULTISPECIES: 4-amino-4-deoxy-L-arabinose-phosphoundecaprenol flippase subunit ArnF [Pantoea]|uniref:4-amino-4-deoxy-L-arabinose-phosphoundecaprenol flippase subunit ArnF n=1 Tax=Pantoea TaxID=53335 RepID=UPI000DE4F0F5|nr:MULTISPECIES: 4-amino-4-deoxy-L-arabinose-phosphoundecaprenol flippase subunit ArnF [Pantoea]RBO13515.1 4-amino-4-deoxy-L-arabinose-phospho-UDP flippase [Pantoea sp. 3_1284]
MKGTGLALVSVALVTLAQLMLRSAMMEFPAFSALLQGGARPVLMLCAGLAAYGLSMLCWLAALRYQPLSQLYPLLSLSYVLVWLAAVVLPWFHEPFRWSSLAGVVLIVAGLLAVSLPRGKKQDC